MKLTPAERKTLARVFADALDWQDSLLATYYTEIDPDDVRLMRVPQKLAADAERVRRQIEQHKKLRGKFRL